MDSPSFLPTLLCEGVSGCLGGWSLISLVTSERKENWTFCEVLENSLLGNDMSRMPLPLSLTRRKLRLRGVKRLMQGCTVRVSGVRTRTCWIWPEVSAGGPPLSQCFQQRSGLSENHSLQGQYIYIYPRLSSFRNTPLKGCLRP